MTGLLWLGLLVIAIGCYIVYNKSSYNSLLATASSLACFVTIIVSVVMLFAWPVSWYVDKQFKAEYEMVKETIEVTREAEGTILERAALTHKIIEINQALAVKKYWNDGLWDWYIPDDVANLEPIR